jgi:hypothetical protein
MNRPSSLFQEDHKIQQATIDDVHLADVLGALAPGPEDDDESV